MERVEMGIQTVEKIGCDDPTGCASLVEGVTRREAMAKAKAEGWTFVERGRKAYCSKHAPEVLVPRADLIALLDGVRYMSVTADVREAHFELAKRVGRAWKYSEPEQEQDVQEA